MSAPDPEVVEFSSVKLPKLTPPFSDPLVFDQKVIGPLADLKSLGAPLTPALLAIRPTDLTRIPWEPEEMFPFRAVVPPDSTKNSLEAVNVLPRVRFEAERINRSFPDTISPLPVVIRDPVLEIEMSWLAPILWVPVVSAPEATSLTFVPLTAWIISTEPPLTSTFPAVEVSVADVPLVTAVDPEIERFPAASIAAVGATEVPPLMVTVPEEVKVADPT
jgi:hypothetical protein